jgi:hypothetical protein
MGYRICNKLYFGFDFIIAGGKEGLSKGLAIRSFKAYFQVKGSPFGGFELRETARRDINSERK